MPSLIRTLTHPHALHLTTVSLRRLRMDDAGALVASAQRLRLDAPDLTVKELHAALTAGEWPATSLSEVKKAASKAKRAAPTSAGYRPSSQHSEAGTGGSSGPPAPAAPSPAAAEPPATAFASFEVGSVVTHEDGRLLGLMSTEAAVPNCPAHPPFSSS